MKLTFQHSLIILAIAAVPKAVQLKALNLMKGDKFNQEYSKFEVENNANCYSCPKLRVSSP